MQTMNISLPDPMKQFVEEQVSGGTYSSASEYVRELVRADQKRKARDALEQTLMDALNSGEPIEVTHEMWEDLRKKMHTRAAARKSPKH